MSSFSIPSPIIRQASKILRPIIHHYEWIEIINPEITSFVKVHPSFSTGLLFHFYQGRKLIVSHKHLAKREMPEYSLIPPTDIVITNSRIDRQSVFRVIFEPGGLHKTFSLPMNEFRNNSAGLDFGYMDSDLPDLYEQMYENPNLDRCIHLMESYLLPKLKFASVPVLHKQILSIVSKYEFLISPKILSEELNMSPWKLKRQMNKEIGFSAEKFIQIYKFCKTVEFFNRNPGASIMDAVAIFGYTDRPHLAKKFKKMSSYTPGQYKELALEGNWKELLSPDYSGLMLNLLEDLK